MTVQAPKTIQDFENIKSTITELLNNPYADKGMIEKLKVRLKNSQEQINNLKKQ